MVPSGWRAAFAQSRFRSALPLSIALHLVVLYAATHVLWGASDVMIRSPTSVVWLTDWRPADREALPEPKEPPQPEVEPLPQDAPITAPEELQSVVVAPPSEPTLADETPDAPPQASDDDVADVATPTPAPTPDNRERSNFAPGIDWDREREQAAARVLEQREREEGYPTLSLDDVPERVSREEPAPPTPIAEAMDDNCVIVKGRLQRFAAQMLGRCVREARGDLFAHIKPAYLRSRPVCVESEVTQPLLVDSRGNEISNVKCRLVEEEEDEDAATAADE